MLILFFGLIGQSHAGLLKQAAKHPALTLGVVGAGAAMMAHGGKTGCRKDSDGMSDNDSCQGSTSGVSIKDKAALFLQKSQTKELRKNLQAAGEDESKGCAAHHIVPQNEKREWAKDDANKARQVLNSCDIGIDDAINGVYLPFNKDAECDGANHRKLHTSRYYREVARLLLNAASKSCDEVKRELGEMKSKLRLNTFIGGVH